MSEHWPWSHAISVSIRHTEDTHIVANTAQERKTYASSEESQHLVNQLIIRKVASHHHRPQDIGLELLCGSPRLRDISLLLAHDITAQVAEEPGLNVDDAVQVPRQLASQPLRQDEVHRQKGHLLA